MDSEGRIITLEFDKFFVTQVYTPNAGDGLKRLAERQIWDEKYADYLTELDQVKPVLATGDYNVAHKEIDLAHPSSNRRSPGFTDEERAGFTNLLAKVLPTLSATSMAIFLMFIVGGRNVAKQAKSTIVAGVLTTGSHQVVSQTKSQNQK